MLLVKPVIGALGWGDDLNDALDYLDGATAAETAARVAAVNAETAARVAAVNAETAARIADVDDAIAAEVARADVAYAPAGSVGAFVGARVYRSTAQNVPSGISTSLAPDTEVADTDGYWVSSTAGRFTVPAGKAGLYRVEARVNFAANSATGSDRQLIVRLNGSSAVANEIDLDQAIPHATARAALSLSGWRQLAVGDFVDFVIYQDSGGALNTEAGPGRFWMAIQRVSA